MVKVSGIRAKDFKLISPQKALISYVYRVPVDVTSIINRLLGWSSFSKTYTSVVSLEIYDIDQRDGVTKVDVTQSYAKRSAFASTQSRESALKVLEDDMCAAWSQGLIHGDLNRKNILTSNGLFRVVDIEPVLHVNNLLPMMATYPYIAPGDIESFTLSAESDLIGLYCFASWLRNISRTPYDAAIAAHKKPELITEYRLWLLSR